MGAGGALAFIPKLFIAIGRGIATIATAGATTIALLILLIVGFVLAWKENFLNIKGFMDLFVQGIKDLFTGMWDILVGLSEVFVGIWQLDWEKIKKGVSRIWKGIVKIFLSGFKQLIGLIGVFGISLIRAFKIFFDFGARMGEILADAVKFVVKKAKGWGIDWLNAFLDGIKSVGSKIFTFFENIIRGVFGAIGGFISKFIGGGGGGGGRTDTADDFILSGGRLIKTNPLDTLVGFKGAPSGVGTEGTVNIDITNNITGAEGIDLDLLSARISEQIQEALERLKRT